MAVAVAVAAAEALCNELVSCKQIPSTLAEVCRQSLAIYVPDPEAAKACIDEQKITCSDVADLNTIANKCLYDTSKFACKSGSTLNICSPDTTGHPSVCKDLDCPAACNQVYGVAGSCGLDTAAGYDKCLCTA